MFDAATALALMQYGDSAYPAGGFAFSWGVEGLAADGWLDEPSQLDAFVAEHLTFRWNSMDRPLLGRGYRATTIAELLEVDLYAEASTPSAEMREGSRRAGRALMGVSARLGGALSMRYREEIANHDRLGHLPVAQAAAYRDAGLDLRSAETISAWTLVNGLVSAATRLGVVGHIDAQKCLGSARSAVAALLDAILPEDAIPASFTPLIDIAVSRGRSRATRLFAT